MSVIIRAAVISDMDAIALIYAHHVNNGTGTFETEPPDHEERASFPALAAVMLCIAAPAAPVIQSQNTASNRSRT
jgi:L-amino acid N-acyltransferase YncA